MGQQLVDYFKKAQELGGIKARVRISILTKISSFVAQKLPDSEENIKIFENALNEIKKEYKK
jgi:hypothetical protein